MFTNCHVGSNQKFTEVVRLRCLFSMNLLQIRFHLSKVKSYEYWTRLSESESYLFVKMQEQKGLLIMNEIRTQTKLNKGMDVLKS